MREINSKKLHIYKKFQQYLKDNINHSRYLYAAVKPTDELFYLVTNSAENCQWLRENLGYFFQGFELKYLVITPDGEGG